MTGSESILQVFSTLAAGATGLGGLAAYARWIEPTWLQIVERDLPVSNLHYRWHHKRLVQMSDVHVGRDVSENYLIDAFERVTQLAPDVVVVTGDFVTHKRRGGFSESQFHAIYEHLPRGKVATVGVLGNHDYGRRWNDPNAAEKLVTLLSDHSVKVLRNEAADLDGLHIIGLDELWAGRCDAVRAFESSSRRSARVVLCHNPDAVDQKMWQGYHGWILAGHTHGGQCKLPFLPPPFLPVANRRYSAGEIDLRDGRRLYVNRGLGCRLPFRFNVRPEITVFRLVSV